MDLNNKSFNKRIKFPSALILLPFFAAVICFVGGCDKIDAAVSDIVSNRGGGDKKDMVSDIVSSVVEPKEVTLVKNAVFEYDKSRTIETALKARCSSLEWNFFVSDIGKKVVEVYGIWKDTRCKQNNDGKNGLLPGDVIHAQFIVNLDDTVDLAYGAFCNPDKSVKDSFVLRQMTEKIFLITIYDGYFDWIRQKWR